MNLPLYRAAERCPYCGLAFQRFQHHESECVTCEDCGKRFVSHVTTTTAVLRVEGEALRRDRKADVARAYA
jgi:hypothetical protein